MATNDLEAHNQVVEKCVTTLLNLNKTRCKWIIHNYSFCDAEVGYLLRSPTFSTGKNGEYEWELKVYPNGDSQTKDYLSLYLRFLQGPKSEIRAMMTFSILNNNGNAINVMKSTICNFVKTRDLGWPKFAKTTYLRDAAHGLLNEDKLIIMCEIITESIVNTVDKRDLKEFEVPKCRLLDDLTALFKSKKLCDVTLVTGQQELTAHKVILAARSPVFAAMFQHGMKEQQQNRVDITDVNYELLKEMLRFIYTGKITNLNKVAGGLLAAADKYQLARLKALSGQALCKSLAIENAACRLILGDLYSCVHLKEQAIDFIGLHVKEVLETASYKAMHNTHPHLIDEVLQTTLTKKIASVTLATAVSK